ncbi:MAG: hypothetical protein U0836_18950 [Pirellulales bacterium]
MVSSRRTLRRSYAWRMVVCTLLLLLADNARPVAAGPYQLGPPGAVITPADGDAALAHDTFPAPPGRARTTPKGTAAISRTTPIRSLNSRSRCRGRS